MAAFAKFAGFVVIAIGLAGLIGAQLGVAVLTSGSSALPPMAPRTAFTLILCGISLLLRTREESRPSQGGALVIGAWVVLVGGITVASSFGDTFGLPATLILREGSAAGKPSFLTGLEVFLVGLTVLTSNTRTKYGRWPLDLFAVAAVSVALLAILGFICKVPSFYGRLSLFPNSATSLPGSIAFALLGAGLLAARSSLGLGRLVASNTAGAVVARRLLLAPVAVPLFTALFLTVCIRTGHYNAEIVGWIMSFINILVFTLLIWWVAALLDLEARERQLAEEQVQKINARLEAQSQTLLRETLVREEQERQRAQSSEDRFRTLVEQSLIGIYVIQDDRFVYVNPMMEKITGFTASVLCSRPLLDSVYPEDRPIVGENVRRRMEGGASEAHYTLRMLRKDQSIAHVEVRGAVSEYSGRRAILGTLLDITARKEAEEKVARLHAELEQRVRDRTAQLEAANRELESFSYTVSHDLRAPLRHIHGYVEMLRRVTNGRLDETALRYLQNVGASSQQMGILIDSLLAFSRMGKVEMRHSAVDLNALVQEVIENLDLPTTNRAIEWKISDLPPVSGDRALLKQVFANLIGNAVKYTRDRSPGRIEITSVPGSDNGLIQFYIRDNGAGFDMRYVNKLFGVFQRLHRTEEFEGNGIGLATVRRILQRHGGDAWAEGELEKGATFYFTLKPAPQPVSA